MPDTGDPGAHRGHGGEARRAYLIRPPAPEPPAPMVAGAQAGPGIAERAAFGALILFLVAVTSALALTLLTVPPAVKILAATAVVPVVGLALVLLLFERRRRAWSFLGAAALGAFGVALRLLINARPSLEVGGGLPLDVNLAYLGLGLVVVATSLLAYAGSVRGRNGVPAV